MWNWARRISAAGMLCCSAMLITAALATLQWSHEHGLRWGLLMLWSGSSREIMAMIAFTLVALVTTLVILGVGALGQRRLHRQRSRVQ